MGILEIINNQIALLKAEIIIYGKAADEALSQQMATEISKMWTEAEGKIMINGKLYTLECSVIGSFQPNLTPESIFNNRNPLLNFFRIEEFANGNISFVDAINCNTGFFKLENLYLGSTTAAHEFGHTIGLVHPQYCDLRGKGIPGIMYPRGTLVDAQYQYDPAVPAGLKGGTMHPQYRKVWKEEVALLQINPKYQIDNKHFVIGDFSNVWHESHDMFA
ncbi:MAG TPA: peptidase M10 [Edaphocola sp.]|nr:peptidase M10 [Edaphocola sp.]